jgi:DNA-binding NarL/FixJ family response regulator
MPEMHGIEMYKQALALDPSLHLRFIFFTGTENPEYLSFIRDSKALMLPKPSPVRLISEMMHDVLASTPVPQETTIH